MSVKVEINGRVVEFEKRPSDSDIEEVARQLGDARQAQGGIRQAQFSPQAAFRRWLMGSELAQPIRSIFFEPEQDIGAERARAFLSGAGKTIGIPQGLRKIAGLQPIEPKTKATGFEMAGKIAGLGLPISVAGKVASGVRGAGLTARMARGLIQGSLTGGLVSPENDFTDIKERARQAKIGGAIGAGATLLSSIPRLINLSGRKSALKIAQKAAGNIDDLTAKLSDKYDDLFSRIEGKTSNVDDLIEYADDVANQFPSGTNMSKIKKVADTLRKIKKEGKGISAKQLHNLKQEVRKIIPKNVWKGTEGADAIQNSQRQLYFKITDKLAEIGGDKYRGLAQEYRQLKEAEKIARKYFYEKNIASEGNMGRPLSLARQKILKEFERQLPSEDRFMDSFLAWRRGQSFKRNLPKIAKTAGLIELGRRALQKMEGSGE